MQNLFFKLQFSFFRIIPRQFRIVPRRLAGYTLVEMLVVIGISTLVLGAVIASVLQFYKANSTTLAQAYAVEGARESIESAVGALRGTQYGSDGSYPISSISPDSVTFYSDTNGDGIPEKVHLYLSGTDFLEGITSSAGDPPSYDGSELLLHKADAVQNTAQGISTFHYYDAANVELSSIVTSDPVSYVTITLVINEEPGGVNSDYTVRSTAALRNVSQF